MRQPPNRCLRAAKNAQRILFKTPRPSSSTSCSPHLFTTSCPNGPGRRCLTLTPGCLPACLPTPTPWACMFGGSAVVARCPGAMTGGREEAPTREARHLGRDSRDEGEPGCDGRHDNFQQVFARRARLLMPCLMLLSCPFPSLTIHLLPHLHCHCTNPSTTHARTHARTRRRMHARRLSIFQSLWSVEATMSTRASSLHAGQGREHHCIHHHRNLAPAGTGETTLQRPQLAHTRAPSPSSLASTLRFKALGAARAGEEAQPQLQ